MGNSVVTQDMAYVMERCSGVSKFRGRQVLITGFAGFLGFSFTRFFLALRQEGIPVNLVLADRFLLGRPAWVEALEGLAGVEVLDLDVGTANWAEVPGAADCSYVIHLASVASPTFYRRYPLETIDANIQGLRGLLEFYRTRAPEGILFFSSSEIYGDPDPGSIPTGEEYRGNVSCVGPRSCYDESKRFGETLCYYYARLYGLPIGVARPFNNYGPGMSPRDRRLPADFAQAVLAGRDLEILSDGTPTRTFCYVADALWGYLEILTHGRYDYFNIGMDRPELSVREFAQIFRQAGETLFGYRGQVRYAPPEDGEYLTHNPNRRCPSIQKAREVLGFAPTIGPREGVERYLRYLKEEAGE